MTTWTGGATPYLIVSTIVVTILLTACIWAMLPERSSRSIIKLSYSPNEITRSEIARLIVLVVLKTILPGLAPPLKRGEPPGTFKLPLIDISGKLRITEGHVKAFEETLPQESRHELINPLFLFTQLNPLVILLLAHMKCPIKPLGSVNTHNTFLYLRPRACCDIEALRRAGDKGRLTYTARFGDAPGTRSRSGVKFSIIIELHDGSKPMLRMTTWFLQFLPRSSMPTMAPGHDSGQVVHQQDLKDAPHRTRFTMTSADPKKWAASCKDYNPIHISKIGAALFGQYSNVIAHGNHVLALIIEQRNGNVTTRAMNRLWQDDQSLELSVQFRSALVVPADPVAVWSDMSLPTEEFVVLGRLGREHLRGTLTVFAAD